MIYTSYFGNVRKLPKNIYPISIARKAPNGWRGVEYKRLAPSWEILNNWKREPDEKCYVRDFCAQILDKLYPPSVVREILRMCPEGMEPCLICYEKPEDFCHRHIVAGWLRDSGYIVKEY